MLIKNCPECGSVHALAGDLCQACEARAEAEFRTLADYLRAHPGTQADGLAKATKIPIKTILKYLSAGRLQVAKQVVFLKCENCKTPIASGKYCEECAMTVDNKALKRLRKAGALHADKNRRHEAKSGLKRSYK